ncbi:hypothetical protein AA106555_1087 [Neokomagataea thailandica NBRC 106555]|uniref:Uncharacterized protein n=1 Tax=Neokomagataea thailandica NBRC 106555 TaxID=1223520 RepID=A0ABQ0QPZ9_9PROT|nr:hypothetical protein AA106555_1087 [Neokomagataea thailandica NBRC 106555]
MPVPAFAGYITYLIPGKNRGIVYQYANWSQSGLHGGDKPLYVCFLRQIRAQNATSPPNALKKFLRLIPAVAVVNCNTKAFLREHFYQRTTNTARTTSNKRYPRYF